MFVAAVPPAPVVESLEEFLAPRHESGDFRWTPQEQWHVTLAFLEDVPDHRLDELVERLALAASRRTTIKAVVAGGVAFPHAGKAKVLAASVEGDLVPLATGARNAAVKAGVVVDGRTFTAHLTLARMGVRPIEASKWLQVLETYRSPDWEINEIALVSSYLKEGPGRRPRYEVVETFPLAGRVPEVSA